MSFLRPLGLLLISCPTAGVAAAIDDQFCRNGIFAVQNHEVGIGRITAGKRAFFFNDLDGCPSSDSRCVLKSYLVTGDEVITGRAFGHYLCVYYPKKGGIAGWLDASRVRRSHVRPDPPLSAWLGRWSDYGNPVVRFYTRKGKLMARADAAWPEFNPPRDIAPGGPHVGEIDEPVRRSGNRAYAPECGVTFTLLGDFLVGADPKMQCGGVNVSFSGVYRRLGR